MAGKKLVHVGCVDPRAGFNPYLFLREENENYRWYRQSLNGEELPTPVEGRTPEEAIRKASRFWEAEHFHSLHCGIRYNMEPRDEHGINALFYEMAQSYDSGTILGDYWDDRCGHRCYVDFASQEALALWKNLKGKEVRKDHD